MKKLKKAIAAGVATIALVFGVIAPASAAVVAPRYGDHVSYWNCKGPTKNPYNYYDTGYYYYCDWDYDWYAEVFWGKVDRRSVLTPAWYSA